MADEAEVVETEPQELDVVDAAEKLNGLFGVQEEPPEGEPAKAERQRGPDGKFLPTKKEPPPEGAETADDPPEVEAPETKEEKEIRHLKVKLDGLEQDVPEDEVVKGYLRQSDYTRKTQELAETRKRFEAEELSAVRQEREAYATRLSMLAEALEALSGESNPDWNTLSKELAPEEFSARFTGWQAQQGRIAKAKAEHERVRSLQEQDAARERQARLAREDERLGEAIPDWKDPEKGKVLRADLVAYAKSIGVSDDEMATIEDHRTVIALHKARLWDESQKRRPKLEEKVDRALSLAPTGAKPAPKQKAVDAMRSRFTKSGTIEDAAALLDSLVG